VKGFRESDAYGYACPCTRSFICSPMLRNLPKGVCISLACISYLWVLWELQKLSLSSLAHSRNSSTRSACYSTPGVKAKCTWSLAQTAAHTKRLFAIIFILNIWSVNNSRLLKITYLICFAVHNDKVAMLRWSVIFEQFGLSLENAVRMMIF
jgi:hypothetical protein